MTEEGIPAISNAWHMGAQGRRLGHPVTRCWHVLTRRTLQAAYVLGWWHQAHRVKCIWPDDFTVLFDMRTLEGNQIAIILNANRKERRMTTRTNDELAALRSEYDTANPDGGDEGFAAHLASIDATAVTSAEVDAPAAKPAKAAKAPKAAKAAKAPKAEKPAKTPKPKAFRPSSEDRQAFNAAAAKVVGKDGGTARMVPASGGTYTDFLQGKTLKLDADGSGSTVLNVVTAKEPKAVLGTVTVTVTKGKVKATGAKA